MFATLTGQQWEETASVLDGAVFKRWSGDGDGSPGGYKCINVLLLWNFRLINAEIVENCP